MKESIREKLELLTERHGDIEQLLSDPATIADQERFRELSREYARLGAVTRDFEAWRALEQDVGEAEELTANSDPELRALGEEELDTLARRQLALEHALSKHLIPDDPDDHGNLFLEIRAGTGGDEAALFAGDLFRMYCRYVERHRWQVELLSSNEGEHGGYREVISRVEGRGAYAMLKFESGAHRVQRVPETEAQGRIHTSACTVAVLPEPAEVDEIEISGKDLRIDTYRASGAGGQHVNKTDSAVRVTHLPSGIVVECQDERSQLKNRTRAIGLLRARLKDAEIARRDSERAAKRRSLVGTGDRSERIRTYNFPQGRVTDHRINLTLYRLDEILAGDLDGVVGPLSDEFQAEQLAALGMAD